jgi:hypothetical protein
MTIVDCDLNHEKKYGTIGIWNTMGISLPDIMDMPHHRRMRAWTLIQKI